MRFLELDKKQRELDGMWETIARVKDSDNAYTYINDAGTKVTLVPDKWITIRVSHNEPVIQNHT